MSNIKLSYRENIAKDIIKAIKSIKSVRYTSRDIFEIDELSEAQFPAVLVQTGSEIKTESSMGNKMGTIEYELIGFVKGKNHYLFRGENHYDNENRVKTLFVKRGKLLLIT